jgi:outer membrane biosynthesis protein TonB/archaellum component FlaC
MGSGHVEDLTQQEQELRAQAAEIRRKLQELATELREVDDDLEALAPRRAQHELLDAACTSLERLGELGAASLFWGDRVEPEQAAGILHRVRERASAFNAELAALDTHRQGVLDRMADHEESLEILGEELYQLREQEERRKLEWIVEREISGVPARPAVMPWSRGGEDDWRLRKSLVAALAASLLAAAILPMVDLPLPKRFEPEDVPERLAQLVRKELPKPQPALADATPEQPKPEEQKDQPKPEEQPKPTEQSRDPVPDAPMYAAADPKPQRRVEKAGILAFKDKFAGLAKGDVAPKLGEGARFSGTDDSNDQPPARAMLTSNAPGSSGGINLASLSRNVGGGGNGGAGGGGGGMHGVAVGRATSAIGQIGGGGGGSDRPRASGGPGLSRTDEEIQIVFDRYKAAFYRLYNRELRKDPTLKGQMILRLTIEPDGSVSMCELYESDMDAPVLATQVVDRVLGIDFGAKEGVQALTIVYPIDFLPAA